MRYQAALRPDRRRACSANDCVAASSLACMLKELIQPAMKTAADSADRVLLFSSIGHGLMHMMTAFYAVIVLTLAAVWNLPVEGLLELYAPAAVLLGVM